MSGVKHDGEKADMSLLSSIAILKVAQVMTFGKRKYSANNWRGGIVYSRLLAAALRHIFSYLGGESKDPETGYSHLAHAMCCLMMVLEFEETQPQLDDRFKQPESIEKLVDRTIEALESGEQVTWKTKACDEITKILNTDPSKQEVFIGGPYEPLTTSESLRGASRVTTATDPAYFGQSDVKVGNK